MNTRRAKKDLLKFQIGSLESLYDISFKIVKSLMMVDSTVSDGMSFKQWDVLCGKMKSDNEDMNELYANIHKSAVVIAKEESKEGVSMIIIKECIEVLKAIDDAEKKLNGKGRVLVRASGTEPKIRIMVEGVNKAFVDSIADKIAETVSISMS